MAPRHCPLCGGAHGACGRKTTVLPVDVYERSSTKMTPLKTYNVGGMDLGDGKPAPADTVLRLDHAGAVRLGLEKPKRGEEAPETSGAEEPHAKPATPESKPRKVAGTRKRPAPSKATA